jgi:type IV fimbrial biogenesis protein FimT
MRALRIRNGVAGGFTLLELVMTVAVFAILAALAMPLFFNWTQSAKIRSVAEGIQNDLRLAQGEAIRQNRQVQFTLTSSVATAGSIPLATANGSNWMVVSSALLDSDTQQLIDSSAGSSDVSISGPTTVTFSPYGRWIDPADAQLTANTPVYTITAAGGRQLDIILNLGGAVRLCDPQIALSQSPTGCS